MHSYRPVVAVRGEPGTKPPQGGFCVCDQFGWNLSEGRENRSDSISLDQLECSIPSLPLRVLTRPPEGGTPNSDSVSRLTHKYVLIDLGRIAEHDEANVAHIFLRHALHVRGCHDAQLFEKLQRVAPAATDQFVLGHAGSLRRVGLLADVIGGQELRYHRGDVVFTDRLALQASNLVQHHSH